MKTENIFFIDTEFNGYQGQLISLALVPVVGDDYFYRETHLVEDPDPWVARHVLEKLDGCAISIEQIQQELEEYLSPYEQVTIIADWPDDIKYFNELLITGPGKAIKTPLINCVLDRRIDGKSTVPHHAQYDAVANRKYYLTHLV